MMTYKSLMICLALSLIVNINIVTAGGKRRGSKDVMVEREIVDTILDGYNLDIRPEIKHGEPLHVHFEMKLQKIVRLDVKHQLFTINSFVRMKWIDTQLSWNKTEFENIDKTNVGTDMIWTPDVVLYNSATEESFAHTDLYKTKALVFHDGLVLWTAPVTWQVSCSFDVTWFPIDRQICTLTFGSWSYMSSQLKLSFYENISPGEINHEQFSVKSGEWEIEDIEMSSGTVKYSCCPDPFSVIKYRFSLRRMALYYFLYIILPLVSQVFLFLMVFHIPCENGERMGFGVTILLSITVYLLVISEKLPEKSDDRPMLGICFIIEFYILSFALVVAAIIVKLSNRTSTPPHFLLRFCGTSKSICCGAGHQTTTKNHANKKESIEMHEANGYLHSKDEGTRFLHQRKTQPVAEQQPPVVAQPLEMDEEEINRKLWRKICNSLDRMCFYGFGFISIFAPVLVVALLDHRMMGV
ncbi:neuronal acetylcholine receptor subunit alpha-6-like [Clytia hemisphaerica]|uniref:Uncharacterized protein n=1 Tax=Clytia hemisphaerica TaxID=252671 RepID=A0A7M5VGN7_9CNID